MEIRGGGLRHSACYCNVRQSMADRKARLAALAAKARRGKKASEPQENDVQDEEPREISFRNYVPMDERLEPPKDDDEPSTKRARTEETKSALQEALEKAQKEVAAAVTDGDVTTMGPKKANADLKRGIQDKLDKLERRTQRAIVALLKERLERDAEADVPELD